MNFQNKDLNLLLVFSAIWEERNISRASHRLHLSQSAVSHALKRMREEFDDPLFVRDSKGVAPTDFALKLAPKVMALLKQMDGLYRTKDKFDPKSEERDLVLATGDYFTITRLESFIARMRKEAPRVRVICRPVANVFELEKFERGEIHLGITALDLVVKEGFHTQELYQDQVAVCVRKKHAFMNSKPSLTDYLQVEHIVVSNFGNKRGAVDAALDGKKKERNVTTVVSSFFDAGRLLCKTDLALTAPRAICESLAAEYNLQVFNLPFEYRPRSISLIWHERTEGDLFHTWVRGIISS